MPADLGRLANLTADQRAMLAKEEHRLELKMRKLEADTQRKEDEALRAEAARRRRERADRRLQRRLVRRERVIAYERRVAEEDAEARRQRQAERAAELAEAAERAGKERLRREAVAESEQARRREARREAVRARLAEEEAKRERAREAAERREAERARSVASGLRSRHARAAEDLAARQRARDEAVRERDDGLASHQAAAEARAAEKLEAMRAQAEERRRAVDEQRRRAAEERAEEQRRIAQRNATRMERARARKSLYAANEERYANMVRGLQEQRMRSTSSRADELLQAQQRERRLARREAERRVQEGHARAEQKRREKCEAVRRQHERTEARLKRIEDANALMMEQRRRVVLEMERKRKEAAARLVELKTSNRFNEAAARSRMEARVPLDSDVGEYEYDDEEDDSADDGWSADERTAVDEEPTWVTSDSDSSELESEGEFEEMLRQGRVGFAVRRAAAEPAAGGDERRAGKDAPSALRPTSSSASMVGSEASTTLPRPTQVRRMESGRSLLSLGGQSHASSRPSTARSVTSRAPSRSSRPVSAVGPRTARNRSAEPAVKGKGKGKGRGRGKGNDEDRMTSSEPAYQYHFERLTHAQQVAVERLDFAQTQEVLAMIDRIERQEDHMRRKRAGALSARERTRIERDLAAQRREASQRLDSLRAENGRKLFELFMEYGVDPRQDIAGVGAADGASDDDTRRADRRMRKLVAAHNAEQHA